MGTCGHFDNPAGFASMLIALLPFAVYQVVRRGFLLRILGICAIGIFLTGLVLSKSRAGLIAAGAIGAICLLRYTYKSFASLSEKIKWLVSVFISACIIGGGISLYFYKKDSADGRLLIWKSSWDMVTDKPFFGHGANAFQPNYMLYQAAYFEKNPNSRFGNLADNVRAPFNEYLGFLIQFGVTGILLLSVLLFFTFRKSLIIITEDKQMAVLSLLGIGILGLFSYPLSYAVVLIMVSLNLFLITRSQGQDILKGTVPVWLLLAIFLPAVYYASVDSMRKVRSEKVWSRLKKQYFIQGVSEQMLTRYRDLYLIEQFDDPEFLYNYGAILNKSGQYQQSNQVLRDCERQLNDCDVQVLQADNYYNVGDYIQAEQCARLASRMCPNRFTTLYQLVLIYDKTGRRVKALQLSDEILRKPMKVRNTEVYKIILKLNAFIQQNE